MNKLTYGAAFGIGLAVIGWIGAGYLQTQPLALGMTLLITAFYLMGALELRRFHEATTALDRALADLAEPPAVLDEWLQRLPASLRNAVRARVEGEHSALPGPALTPYLVGLLVLLGMLGTFLGMVVTLSGTSLALERATDLQTMRDSLAAPVKGLGLAFGTSVAGVATSALLGLMSALCRRQRQQTLQRLDTHMATTLFGFTRTHQRQQALQLQQQQAQLLPLLVERLQAAMTQADAQAQQSNERLLASQERFQGQAEAAYRGLATSVDESLRQSLADSARIVASTIQPAVESTMSGITRETAALHGHIAGTLQQQLEALAQRLGTSLDGFSQRVEQRSSALLDGIGARLDGALQRTQQAQSAAAAHFDQQSAALLRTLEQSHAGLQTELAERDAQRLAAWTSTLAAMATSLERSAGQISAQAEAHARSTIAEISRLVQTASDAPRAAAEVVAQLRDKLSDSMVRDNAMLEERSHIMSKLNTLLDAVQRSSSEQQAAITSLVESSSAWLQQASARFGQSLEAESARMESAAAQVAAGAVDVASLGEAFGAAAEGFAHSSDKLMAHLQRVDETLGKAIARSDEQLAYYVAQAREVIDLSLTSQKQIVEDLQRIAGRRATVGSQA
jgi:hypothetical protein